MIYAVLTILALCLSQCWAEQTKAEIAQSMVENPTKFQSAEGEWTHFFIECGDLLYPVERTELEMFGSAAEMHRDNDWQGATLDTVLVPLPQDHCVSPEVMGMLFTFVNNHKTDGKAWVQLPRPFPRGENLNDYFNRLETDPAFAEEQTLKKEDRTFLQEADAALQHHLMIFQLMNLANFLDVKGLVDLTTCHVASLFTKKTSQEIRDEFGIVDDRRGDGDGDGAAPAVPEGNGAVGAVGQGRRLFES